MIFFRILQGMEGNKTLKQEQVQQFLDHAAKVHDTKLLNGDKVQSGELFPKPVYEESPLDQRNRIINHQRRILQQNLTSLVKYDESIDIPR